MNHEFLPAWLPHVDNAGDMACRTCVNSPDLSRSQGRDILQRTLSMLEKSFTIAEYPLSPLLAPGPGTLGLLSSSLVWHLRQSETARLSVEKHG